MKNKSITDIGLVIMFIAGIIMQKVFDTDWLGILFTIIILSLILILNIKFANEGEVER